MLLKFFNKYKFDMWLNNIKDKIYDIYHFQKAKKNEDLYEARWVWYHTILVIELFIIIILLW